jgi:hypothetical protein
MVAPLRNRGTNNRIRNALRRTEAGRVEKRPQVVVTKPGGNNVGKTLKPLIKYPKVKARQIIKTTFDKSVTLFMPLPTNGTLKKRYPVNYESRYEFQGNKLITNRNLTYTGGNFNNSGRLRISGNAGATAPANSKYSKVYNPDEIYNNIITPLINTYATPDIKNNMGFFNYSLVLRSRKSKSNQIHWHTNARQTKELGTSIWQIIYYVDTPKIESNGIYSNAKEEQRGKLRFIISRTGTDNKPIVGELSPHAGIGVGAIPAYFYHNVIPPVNVNTVTTRQIIVLSVYSTDRNLPQNVLNRLSLYNIGNAQPYLNNIFTKAQNKITGPNKPKPVKIKKFTENSIRRAYQRYVANKQGNGRRNNMNTRPNLINNGRNNMNTRPNLINNGRRNNVNPNSYTGNLDNLNIPMNED